jgi:hypothetical protein
MNHFLNISLPSYFMITKSKFINREKELSFLNKLYNNKESDLFILYGRRRIGKTKLALEFIKNKPSVYYMCTEEGDLINIKQFQKELSLIVDNDFNNLKIDNWNDLFTLFFKYYTKKEKLVIVIDEFPYLIKKNSDIPSIFQKVWDQLLINKNIILILTGSSISIMEKKVLNIKSPLYGRRTAQWELEPINFNHFQLFLPKYNIKDLCKIYFVFGGIPAYLLKLDPNKSVKDNIVEQIFTKGNFLNQEGNLLLNYEFSETTNYKLILSAIAQGHQKQKEIVDYTHLDYSLVSKYLFVLKNLSLIVEEIPITENKRFKGRLYKIKDNYLEFWFKYLFLNKSFIESHTALDAYNFYEKNIDLYYGRKFEELINDLFLSYKLPFSGKYTDFGRMWGAVPKKQILDDGASTYEIDVVGLDKINKKNILFCEVKWSDNINANNVMSSLTKKAKYVKWGFEDRVEEYIVVARSFTKKISSFNDLPVKCFDLEDISKLLFDKII